MIRIFVSYAVMNSILHFFSDFEKEKMGFLLGKKCKSGVGTYIVIEEIYTDFPMTSTPVSVRPSREGMYKITDYIIKSEGGDVHVLGWAHSHLGYGVFCSATDTDTMGSCFNNEYQVALVVDCKLKQYGFFMLSKEKDDYFKVKAKIITDELYRKWLSFYQKKQARDILEYKEV